MTRLQVGSPRVRRSPATGSGLLVCAPLRLEARAVRRGLRSAGRAGAGRAGAGRVVATGYGPARAAAQADALRQEPFAALAVAGTGGGLAANHWRVRVADDPQSILDRPL